MAYILDIAVILIFLLAIFIGYRRGFIKAAIKLVGCVLAVVIAGLLSTAMAGGIFDAFMSEKIETTIVDQIQAAGTGDAADSLREVADQLPDFVTNALEAYGLGTPDKIIASLEGSLNGSAVSVAETVVAKVVRPVAVALLRTVCFFILFILLMIVVGIVASLVNKVFKFPLLKQVNGVLGAVVGAVEGIVLIFVAVTVVQLMANSSDADAFISSKDVKDSILVSRLADANPITGALESVLDAVPKI